MESNLNIQWYPGHMTKALRQMEADIREVDGIIEMADARIPFASRNPELTKLRGEKPALLVLGRADLADPAVTKLWTAQPNAIAVVTTQKNLGKQIFPALQRVFAKTLEKYAQKGQVGRKLKLMVAGIPNSGKSTLINSLSGRRATKAENRPGVTRGRQWVSLDGGFALLDTPGLLWPKFDDPIVAQNLAFTGAVRDEVMDLEAVALALCGVLSRDNPSVLQTRYGVDSTPCSHPSHDTQAHIMEQVARKRGFLVSGGDWDIERTAKMLLTEFRTGKLGRISLEKPLSIDNSEVKSC